VHTVRVAVHHNNAKEFNKSKCVDKTVPTAELKSFIQLIA